VHEARLGENISLVGKQRNEFYVPDTKILGCKSRTKSPESENAQKKVNKNKLKNNKKTMIFF
jgi:hypothetical protein